jgi:hypothetical protein
MNTAVIRSRMGHLRSLGLSFYVNSATIIFRIGKNAAQNHTAGSEICNHLVGSEQRFLGARAGSLTSGGAGSFAGDGEYNTVRERLSLS